MQTQEEKKVLDKKFDVLNVINKTYADSSEYDLNDTLIYLSKVISQTKNKNKELVKSNFSKFVECRIVLEEILQDIKKKGFDKDFSSDIFKNIKYVKNNFNPIKCIDNYSRNQKLIIINKYKTLFNIKSLLSGSFDKQERFVEIYKEAKLQYKEVENSKFMQNIWNSIKDITIQFLEKLYAQITDEKNNYMEVLYIFNLYFQVAEIKTDRKIMNTLLVNFKEKCLDMPFTNKGIYLKEINYFFLKTIIHLDKDLQKNCIIYLFQKIKLVFSESNFEFIDIWIFKYTNLLPDDLELEVKDVYYVNLKSLKKDIIDNFIDKNQLYDSYIKIRKILYKNEMYLVNHKVLNIIKTDSENITLEKSEDIEKYFLELNRFDKFLQSETDDFDDIKRQILNNILRKKISVFKNFLTSTQSKSKKLMEIIRIIDKLPDYYEIIFKGVIPVLENDKVILFFVNKILNIEGPRLNNQQTSELENLMPQFGFILHNSTI